MSLTSVATVLGGNGGDGGAAGGAAGSVGGNGGTGGVGLYAGSGVTLTNAGKITGGNGGAGGAAGAAGTAGQAGAGGAGLVGSNLTVVNSGTISGGLANSGTGTQADAITFTGGSNSLTLSNAGTIGTLTGGIGITGALTINPGTAAGSNVTLANTIHDVTTAGSLTKAGAGTLTLTGANTYTGGTTFGAGILNVGSAGALGTTGTLSFTGGTLQYSAANQTDYSSRFSTAVNQLYSIDTNGQAVTFASALSSRGGSLTKLGAGTLMLTSANFYTGGTTVSGGTLQLDHATSGTIDAAGTGGITVGNATLEISKTGTLANSGLTLSGSTSSTVAATAGTTVTVTSPLTISTPRLIFGTTLDTGTIVISGSSSTTFGSSNPRVLEIAGGTLKSDDVRLPFITSYLTTQIDAGGTFDLNGQTVNGYSTVISNLQGGTATTGGILTNIAGATTEIQGGSFAGQIEGAASNAFTTGTTTLSGTNTYTGATTISGTLALAGTGSIAQSSGVALATGGTFDISGLTNGGTSITSLGNTTTGQTGTVALGANILTLTNASGTFGGTIGGTGGLTLTGGTETLSGANTYTGATTISGGTLRGGAANAFSAASATGVATGGTLDLGGFAQTINAVALTGGTLRNGALTGAVTSTGGTVDGLGGTASVTMTSGTTVATGTNTYTGATTINGGTLQIDGVITASNIIVGNGGTLSGTGKIGDPLIAAGGTLSPGNAANPTGTLTIVGPLTFAAGSYYNVNITPTANSRTNVVGTTTIQGGTVQVLAGSGTYATNTRYTILTSTGGVAGTFTRTTANTNFAFLTPTLSYDANDVYVTVLPSTPIVTTNPTTGAQTKVPDYRTAAGTQNQRAVAGGLTQAGIQNGGTGRVLTALNQLTVPQAQAAFDALSGEGLTAAQNIANRSAALFTSSIFDQTTFYASGNAANAITLTEPIRELADLPSRAAPPVFVQPNRTWRAWATGFGGVDDIHGNGQIGSSYQQNTIYGGTLGVDYQLMPNYLVGVAIGGTNGDFLVPGRATSGSTTGGHVAFYDLATFGSFYGASSTSFSYFGNRATRTVSGFGGLGTETERANFNSDEFRTRLEFGRHLAGYGGVLTPFVALELAQLRSNGFTESSVQGAGLFRLNVSGQSQASAPAFVGLRLQRATSLGNNITLSPTLQVAYVHEFAPYRSQIGTLADLPGSTFLIDGARPARNAAQVKAGAEMAIGARSMIFANFDGEFSGVNQLYAGKGGFRYMW